jgi:hypothetical protein
MGAPRDHIHGGGGGGSGSRERERLQPLSLFLSLHHYFMFVLLAQIRAEQQCAHSIELINHLSQQHARAMQVTRGAGPPGAAVRRDERWSKHARSAERPASVQYRDLYSIQGTHAWQLAHVYVLLAVCHVQRCKYAYVVRSSSSQIRVGGHFFVVLLNSVSPCALYTRQIPRHAHTVQESPTAS